MEYVNMISPSFQVKTISSPGLLNESVFCPIELQQKSFEIVLS